MALRRADVLLFLEILVELANWLATPSVWDISLQRNQRGSGADSALLVRVKPETVTLPRRNFAETNIYCTLGLVFCSILLFSTDAPCPRDLLIPARPLDGTCKHCLALISADLLKFEKRGSLYSHLKLFNPAREWVYSEVFHMHKHFFMVNGTCNECTYPGFPL